MKKKSKVLFIQLFQVRTVSKVIRECLSGIGNTGGWSGISCFDLSKDSEFVCNEISMDRAMAVADNVTMSTGNMCVIIPMTAVTKAKY